MNDNNAMTRTDKVAIGLAGIGAAGLLAYGIYYNLTGVSVVSQCEAEQQAIFNQWIATLETYLKEDSASGISLTQEQTSNLNTILANANAQQQVCINSSKQLNQSITSIISTASGIISSAIAIAIIIYGLSKAYSSIKNKQPPKPPTTGGGLTWEEAAAFLTPIITEALYENGEINLNEAEAMSTVATNTIGPDLYQYAQDQVAYFVNASIMTEEEETAYLAVAESAIDTDMELIAIAVLA